MDIYILGISAFYHDSAACLIKNGVIIAAAQEERFTRKKHDAGFPSNAINYCINFAGINIKDIAFVSFYDKPFLKFERILETYLAYAPVGIKSFIKAMPLWIKEKLWMKELIKNYIGFEGKIIFPEHHESHAASAFFSSPFNEAAFLTVDGVGEWTTTSFGTGINNKLEIIADINFPHSLGLLYSAFTYYTGFKVNSGEYKVMGLAPYGEPRYKDLILNELIDIKEDGSFAMNMKYFNYAAGLTMTNNNFNNLFRGEPRKPESKLTQREMDLAASVQVVTEEIMLKMAKHVKKETGQKNLTLAGGVALNCVANGKILKEKIFNKIWIQPAAGDAGGAIGSALATWYLYLQKERIADDKNDSQFGSYLGPEYNDEEITNYLINNSIPFEKLSEQNKYEVISGLIMNDNVIGWFNGRMEFGPRALGARSIIGNARSPKMQSKMNLKIKYRESFRPFAPAILEEKVSEYFEMEEESPYMLLVADVKNEHRLNIKEDEKKLWGIDKLNISRSTIPAVTHIDYSARIQTVNEKTNHELYKLLKTMDKKYNCPIIINTSFNVRGEPIVSTLEDAYRCFMRTKMDYLLLGNYLLKKTNQPKLKNDSDWQKEFELD